MKIVIINTTATFGSTGKIAQILREGYEQAGHDVTIAYGRQIYEGRHNGNTHLVSNKLENVLSILGQRILGLPGLGCEFSTKKFLHFLENEKPDIIQLLNIHGYYLDEFQLLDYLKKKNIKTIYTMCDEYPFTGKCGFAFECDGFMKECTGCQFKKTYPSSLIFNTSHWFYKHKEKCYSGFENIIFTGCGYVAERANQSSLLHGKTIKVVGEPIDMKDTFYPRNTNKLREKLGIPDGNKVLLTVAVLSNERKGGRYFIDLCNMMQDLEGYSYVFVGYNTHKYDYITPSNMIRIPYVESLDLLAQYFSLADIFIATTLADTVPNAVINSLACGTPVCAFNIGGMSSIQISDPAILKLTPTFNVKALKDSVLTFQKKTDLDIRRNRDAVYNDFSSEGVVNTYLGIIQDLTKDEK